MMGSCGIKKKPANPTTIITAQKVFVERARETQKISSEHPISAESKVDYRP